MVVNLDIPERLRNRIQSRAHESGHQTIEQYILALVQSDAEGEDFGAPDHLRMKSSEELEVLIQKRLDDGEPTIEATPEFWKQLRARTGLSAGPAHE